MIGATLFSGVGAPECASPEIDWRWAAENDPFPSAVLKCRFSGIPNLGDVTADDFCQRAIEAGRPDILVFGSPCQDFSVAGKRLGISAPRGNLALVALGIAERLRPRWLVFENVPGLLSNWSGAEDGDIEPGCQREAVENSDFAAFLGELRECGYLGCWRVLDAQFAGVPQRRRRIFFVGYLEDWRPPAAVLLEPESLSGNPPPRRKAGEGIARDIAPCVGASGRGFERAGDTRGQDAVIAIPSTGDISYCLNADGMGRQDYETEPLISHSLRADGFDASEDGTGRGTPLMPVSFGSPVDTTGYQGDAVVGEGDVFPALPAQGGNNGGGPGALVCFTAKDHGADALEDCSPTLRAGGHDASHANAGVMPAVTVALRGREGGGVAEMGGDTATALRASQGGGDKPHVLTSAVAFDDRRGRCGDLTSQGDLANTLHAAKGQSEQQCVASAMAVRRLTPVECERLQGLPDGWTNIVYRGKPAADGPRYKAIGNSMAVPVIKWILDRIVSVDQIIAKTEEDAK